MKEAILPITLMIFCCWYIDEWPTQDRIVDIASQYVGIEAEDGRHPDIDWWLTKLDLPLGVNYCAAFVSHVLDTAEVDYPRVRSGVAQHFITSRSIKATRVMQGAKVPRGSIAVWKRGYSWMGHAGILEFDWSGPEGKTIEANTSPGYEGSQREGMGVYRKKRQIIPTAYLRITHITPTN